MEGSAMLMENLQAKDPNAGSKSIEAPVKINSISIDLVNATNEKNDSAQCEHFSIRGFVSKVRKKDWKKCWPFASDIDSDYNYEEQSCVLPLLHVPKFRFWQCKNCLEEIGCKGNANEPTFKSCSCGFKSNLINSNAPESCHASVPPSDLQQASKLEMHGKTKEDDPACLNKSVKDHFRNTWLHNDKGKRTDFRNGEVAVTLKLKRGASSSPHRPVLGHDEVSNDEFPRVPNLSNKSSSRDFATENKVCGGDQDEVVAGKITEKADMVCAVRHRLVESGNTSSESSDAVTRKEHRNPEHDSSSSSQRRKTRKMRLLTELLCQNGDQHTGNFKSIESLPSAVPDVSATKNKLSVSQPELGMSSNVGKGPGHKRKRKSSQDIEWRPEETSSPTKLPNKFGIIKRDVEVTDAVAGSGSQQITSKRLNVQMGTMRSGAKSRVDKSLSKKKKKRRKRKNLIIDKCPSSSPTQEVMLDVTGNDVADSGKGKFIASNVLSKSVPDAVVAKEIDLFPLTASKKEEKTPQIDPQINIIPQNHETRREAPTITRKETKIRHDGPTSFKLKASENISSEGGLNLSLNSYMTTQGNDNGHIARAEGKPTSPTWKDQIVREPAANLFVENLNFGSPCVPFGKSVNDGFSKNRGVSILHDRQNYISHFEIGGCSSSLEKDFCVMRSGERSIGVEKHSVVTRKDSERRSDKGSEQGALDDIPMEIVELMAKNQYERCLPDTEHDRCYLQTSNNAKNSQTFDPSSMYRHEGLNFLPQQTTKKQKVSLQNGGNEIIKSREILGLVKQKSVDYFSQAAQSQFDVNKLGSFLQDKQSNFLQQSGPCFGRLNSSTRSCDWIGDVGGRKPSPPKLQVPGPCNTCSSTSKQGKEPNDNGWSHMISNRTPFLYGISSKSAAPSANVGPHSRFLATSLPNKNTSRTPDLKFTNLGKQNSSFGFDSVSRTGAESPFSCKHNGIDQYQKPTGSMDLYSNATIPAMHLLSLMDAGLRSNTTPINTSNSSKRASSMAHDQNLNEMAKMSLGPYRSTNYVSNTPYGFQSKFQVRQESRDHSPVIAQALVGPSAASIKHDKSFNKAANFDPPVHNEREKRKGYDLHMPGKASWPEKPTPKVGTNFGSSALHNIPRMFFSDSIPMSLQSEHHALGKSTRHKLDVSTATGTLQPHTSSLKNEICSINRNPADFSFLQPGNGYMIAGEDLKFTRGVLYPKRPQLVKLDGRKRRKRIHDAKDNARPVVPVVQSVP